MITNFGFPQSPLSLAWAMTHISQLKAYFNPVISKDEAAPYVTLLSPNGSSYQISVADDGHLVSTLQPGKGTTTPSNATAMVDVRDYGAVGDGVSDDGSAFNTALTSGQTVLVPTGTYKIATAVSIPANTSLVLLAGTILNLSAKITIGDHAALVGPACAMNPDDATGSAIIFQTNGANLAHLIEMSGKNAIVESVTIQGNKTNNASAGVGIYIIGNRASMVQVLVKECKTHGIEIFSTPTGDAACCGKLLQCISYNNGGSGLYLEQTADWFVNQCEFEANGAHGIEANNSPTMRIVNTDMGGNTRGFYAYGQGFNAGVSLGSNGHLITNCQFGNNTMEDIFLDGGASGGASLNGTYANVIVGNEFIGSQSRPDATYACIRIKDNGSGGNMVTGNSIVSPVGNTFTYGIQVQETNAGNEGYDMIMGNVGVGTLATAMDVGTGKTFLFNYYNGTAVMTGLGSINGALVAGLNNNSLIHELKQGHDTQMLVYSDTAGEIVIEADQASSPSTKFNLNLNKYGGGYLMGNGAANLSNFASDALAAAGGIALGQLYRNGSIMQIRVT